MENRPSAEITSRGRRRLFALILFAAAVHSAVWGVFIIVAPDRSAVVYGFRQPLTDSFLWQGTGLMILLLGCGYALAACNYRKHWGIVAIGLAAKLLGPAGMLFSVSSGQVPCEVLYLIPINDCLWWIPFALIIRDGLTASEQTTAHLRR